MSTPGNLVKPLAFGMPDSLNECKSYNIQVSCPPKYVV